MKVSLVFLAVLSVSVAVCMALPYEERQEEPKFSEGVVHRLPRSPIPEDKKDTPRGGIRTKITDESGVGLTASVKGKSTVYESDDGKSRVNVEGEWSKVLDGPQRGKPQHKGGISWDIDFD